MGIMMGGFLSWLWVVQAMLIGVLFLGSNYYLWLGMERIPGSERFRKFIPYMLMVLAAGFMVWATPRSLVVTLEETRAMGGTHHPVLGLLGVMSAKNTAVNLDSHLPFCSRSTGGPTRSREAVGEPAGLQGVFSGRPQSRSGIYGYFVESIVASVLGVQSWRS
jgi:hypothetical protein